MRHDVGNRLATLTLQSEIAFATPADRSAFTEELAGELARLAAKYHDENARDARRFKLFLGAYPDVGDVEVSQPQPEEIDD